MKNGKAPGVDGIPAEIFKHGGDDLALHLHQLILLIWRTEEITSDLQDADIVKIFKKGDKSDCGNYRGISLLATARKIIARILANRQVPHADGFLPESQFGFRPNRGTTDMIFTAGSCKKNVGSSVSHYIWLLLISQSVRLYQSRSAMENPG